MSLPYHINFEKGLFGKYKKVAEKLPPKSCILDIGCHTGTFGKILIQLGHQVTGIDKNEEALEIARKNGLNVILGDIEDYKVLSSINKQFDVILLMDVLEHLLSPVEVLKRLHSLLKIDGCLIITGPNVGYWAVRKDLLLRRWHYSEAGILDKTHLHFYTASSWKKLIEDGGYKIITFESAEGFIPLEHIFSKLPIFRLLVTYISNLAVSLRPELFTTIFLIEAVPKS